MSHKNNFGLLRLVFALLVIVAHSFAVVDGYGQYDPLTFVFGTINSGELGVKGFFLVSGFLVAQSFDRSKSVPDYLLKRVLRIYPGYIVAALLSLFLVGPLSGADLSPLFGVKGTTKMLYSLAVLRPPQLPNSFSGLPLPYLNGSMWTISYEFRCYILVIAVGLIGLYVKPRLFSFIALVLLFALPLTHFGKWPPLPIIKDPNQMLRFVATFFVGSAFYVWRARLSYRNDVAALAAIALCGLMFSGLFVDIAVAVFGGYLVFWFAFLPHTPRLNAINNEKDISYGLYLYAWPIQNLLIWYFAPISPLLVMLLATIGACMCGYGSWLLVEKPFLALRPRRQLAPALSDQPPHPFSR